MTYKGWHVQEHVHAPLTGRWQAQRHGVHICAGTTAALASMIDSRPGPGWDDTRKLKVQGIGLRDKVVAARINMREGA